MINDTRTANSSLLRDCISGPLIAWSAKTTAKPPKKRQSKGRKNEAVRSEQTSHAAEDNNADTEELADFINYIAEEVFNSLPPEIQDATYSSSQSNPRLAQLGTDPMPSTAIDTFITSVSPTVIDSLEAYGLLPNRADLPNLLIPVFQDYINTSIAPPPVWSATRADACEICERDWIPLTYHHLIPKQIHAKALKRGWHEAWALNSVAWLCRACHSFVHKIAGNEELAKDLWSVELLMQREEIQAWARWVGKVRWKAR